MMQVLELIGDDDGTILTLSLFNLELSNLK